MASSKSSTPPDRLARVQWTPMPGFVEVGPNIWQPANYKPSPFELATPAIRNQDEADVEYSRCANSLKYFAFHHVWSLHGDDPTGRPRYRKIPAYDYLGEFFDAVQVPCNVHIEKSRQMLMSIAWCVVFVWDMMFHENWADLAVSRLEKLVDDGGENATTNSLFGKIISQWQSLPIYLRHPLTAKKNLILSPETNSHIAGHAGSPAAGRGSTFNRTLMDECAHLEYGNTLFASLSQVSKRGLAMSDVPNGTGNVFARVRFLPNSGFKKLHFHWSVHPEKAKNLYCQCGFWRTDETDPRPPRAQYDEHVRLATQAAAEGDRTVHHPRSPWYDLATGALTPEIVAAEFDINYALSRRGRVFGTFDASRHVLAHEARVGERHPLELEDDYRRRYLRSILEPDKPCVVGWDFGVDDSTSLVLGQVLDEDTMTIRWLDDYEQNNKSWDHYHAFVNGLWAPIVREVTGLDLMHYGDPSGRNRDSDLSSWVKNLRSREPRIVIVHNPKRGSLLEWVDFVHNIIRKGHFEVSSYAAAFIDHLEQYHYPTDANGNPVPGRQLPVHDEHSHACSAFRYVYEFRFSHRLIGDGRLIQASDMLDAGIDGALESSNLPSPREETRKLRYF